MKQIDSSRDNCAGTGWDVELPENIVIGWSALLCLLQSASKVPVTHYCFERTEIETGDDESVSYQLHGFK